MSIATASTGHASTDPQATPTVIAVDALLAAFDGPESAGADIRQDYSPSSPFFKLKDARAAARAAERALVADDEDPGMAAEWRTILDIAPDILTGKSKDLEVACWYTEALTRAEGFAGLRDGLLLMAGLVENFWDGLHPLPDEDGMETRVAPLTGLNGDGGEGALIQPIRKLPLTFGQERDFALWQYQQACQLATVSDENTRQARIANGVPTLDAVQKSARETPVQAFKTLLADIDGCIGALKRLSDLLDDKAGHDGPPLGNIRNVLAEARDAVADLGRDKLAMAEQQQAASAAAVVDAVPTAAGTDGTPGGAPNGVPNGVQGVAVGGRVLATREDAFVLLLQVAEFFRKNEPHSPISYTLEELVRRGRLSLPELLQELIENDDARKYFFLASGIKPPTPPESSEQSSSNW